MSNIVDYITNSELRLEHIYYVSDTLWIAKATNINDATSFIIICENGNSVHIPLEKVVEISDWIIRNIKEK